MHHRIGMGLTFCVLACSGCAAFHPLTGVPARNLPDEYRLGQRSGKTTIDLSTLRQTPPPAHLVDSGDVLGIYVEGLLGHDGDVPPVYLPQDRSAAPSVGYPIAVQPDGTISLPSMMPWYVRGLTIREVEQLIRRECTEGPHALLQKGQDRILVSLQRPRIYSVLVIRQETDNPLGSIGVSETTQNSESEKRGTGRTVLLPAYKNDVLHALAETGGLPGLDAQNAVYIVRGYRSYPPGSTAVPVSAASGFTVRGQSPTAPEVPTPTPQTIAYQLPYSGHSGREPAQGWTPPNTNPYQSYRDPRAVPGVPNSSPVPQGAQLPPQLSWISSTVENPSIIRISLQQYPGENPKIAEQDVILQDGDIVFLESRDMEFFYTGGLLGGGQYTLPRDYDITVLDAISIAESRGKNYWGNSVAVGGVSALNHDITVGASKVIISRKQSDGSMLNIEVDLYQAMRDPALQIVILPEDRLYLRYTRVQAVFALLERHFLEGFLIGAASRSIYSK